MIQFYADLFPPMQIETLAWSPLPTFFSFVLTFIVIALLLLCYFSLVVLFLFVQYEVLDHFYYFIYS